MFLSFYFPVFTKIYSLSACCFYSCDMHRHTHKQISRRSLIWEKLWPHRLFPPSPFSCPNLGDPQSCPCGVSPSSSKAEMEPPTSQKAQPWCWGTASPLQVSGPRCLTRAATQQSIQRKGAQPIPPLPPAGMGLRAPSSKAASQCMQTGVGAPAWLPRPNGSSGTHGPDSLTRSIHYYCPATPSPCA